MQFNSSNGRLLATEVHGFHTMEDLDIPNTLSEAKSRWLRPNEIHAILSNYTYFTINVKPVNLPKGGTIVLFDRKKLRNFRKDGHNWRKKKDGKTVKEAHEHLKVGTEERIHVYYAHGEDNPTFVRRCYWLLDKALEHIVLVHYRDTQELQGSPVTPVNSDLGSDVSDRSASQLLSGVSDGQANQVSPTALKEYAECGDSISATNYQLRLHEINTLDWDELLASNDTNEATLATKEQAPTMQQYRQNPCNFENNGNSLLINQSQADMPASNNDINPLEGSSFAHVSPLSNALFSTMGGEISQNKEHRSYNTGIAGGGNPLEKDGLQRQDSFGRWINDIIVDSPVSVDDPSLESSGVSGHGSFMSSATVNHERSIPAHIFIITDISQSWASSSEDTKILVVGYFHQEYQHLAKSNIFCVCGDACISAETIQPGVFRCLVPPHNPGSTSLYLSIDRSTPISQVLSFEFRSLMHTNVTIKEEKPQWDMFRIQTRLSHLLFSTSKSLDIISSKVSPTALKEGKKFALKYSNIADSWAYFNRLVEDGRISFERAKDGLFELAMKSRLKEWLLERVIDGSKISERDAQGQGVLHLCAILDYTWVVYPYSACGMSLDFRDKFGWTALHWAAYYGREKMVAALLSAGAKPNLVSDPTPENPDGCTPADIAHKQGFEGLSAYLSEKALVQQFEDMKSAGNVGGSLGTPTEMIRPDNISEEEIYLKDTLTAYRTAADAAARIHVAFRERSLKQRTNDAQIENSEAQARYIVAAMKIQHAFRNYDTRKKMAAAAHIQHRFRAWKLRREFLNLRRQAIKIQSIFRGFQVRRQYRKICWSVGVLEKAILRWRLKRKGFRGLKVEIQEPIQERSPESDTEEDFYRASRQQAEVRVEKAVVRVQAMFRSRQAQQEYRRMKLAHAQAQHEYDESINPYAYLSHM